MYNFTPNPVETINLKWNVCGGSVHSHIYRLGNIGAQRSGDHTELEMINLNISHYVRLTNTNTTVVFCTGTHPGGDSDSHLESLESEFKRHE